MSLAMQELLTKEEWALIFAEVDAELASEKEVDKNEKE